jgi:hypothetical protein
MKGEVMTAEEIKNRITEIFEELFPTASEPELDLVPRSLMDGKIYEAYILAVVARELSYQEGMELRLVNGNLIQLKSSHGPINRSYPCIEVYRDGSKIGEIWTDIEYLTLSYSCSYRPSPNKGDFHELDILMVTPGVNERPRHDQVLLGVECKNTEYNKGLLKDILGVRRELSYLQDLHSTIFNKWPRSKVPADPPSCLLVYSTSPSVQEYADPGRVFGIDFFHKVLPSS